MNILEKYSLEISVTSFWVTFLFLGPFAVGVNNIDFMVNTGGLVWIGILGISLGVSYTTVKLTRKTDEKFQKNVALFLATSSFVVWLLSVVLADANLTLNKIGLVIPSFIGKILILFLSILVLIYLLRNKPVRIAFIGFVILGMQLVGVVSNVYNIFYSGATTMKIASFDKKQWESFSKDENILLIIVDSLRGDILEEIIEEEYYAHKFKDFLVYSDSISAMIQTVRAVPFILTGNANVNHPGKDSYVERQELLSSSMNKSVLNLAKENGYTLDILSTLYAKSMYQIETDNSHFEEKILFGMSWWSGYETSDIKHIYSNFFSHFFTGKIKKDLQQNYFVNSAKEDNNLLKVSLNKNKNNGCFKMIHLWGTHIPIFLDKEGNEIISSFPEPRANYIGRAKGILDGILSMMIDLEKLEIYDETMIIIVADHGMDFEKGPTSNYTNLDLGKYSHVGLMIKPKNQRADRIKIDNSKVYNGDLAKTIADNLGWKNDFEGYNILNNKEVPLNRERYFAWFSNESTNVIKYKLTGAVRETDQWSKIN